MANINEILARAAALRDETALNSIDPERAGGIMYDTLMALNELWLQQGAALVISKIYASVAAMNADTSPVSDLTGKPIRPGMIVVIASSDTDNGSVYRYNGTSAPRWSLVGKIGNFEPVDSLDSDSTQLPLAAHQGKVLDGKISQLGQYADNPEWVRIVTDANDRILYGVKTDGKFYFGDGCPPQIVEYISAQLGSFSAEDYADIKTFLGNLIDGDTLASLLNAKVDKVEGESLIDADVAENTDYVQNPEWIEVKTDSEDKILVGIKVDGTKVENLPIEIPSASIESLKNPEWLSVTTDKDGRIIEGITIDGKKKMMVETTFQGKTFEDIVSEEFTNKSTLDKFEEEDGKLLWDGNPVEKDCFTKAESNALFAEKSVEESVSEQATQISSLNNAVSTLVETATPLANVNKIINAADFGFEPSNSAADNVVALNTALYGGNKTLIISKPGTYHLNDSIVLDSNTTLICGNGVILYKDTTYFNVFINRGAATRVYDENISLIGLHIYVGSPESGDIHMDMDSPTFGLRGILGFCCVNNLILQNTKILNLGHFQWGIQVNACDGLLIENTEIRGLKDGIHVASIKNFIIRNYIAQTADDPIGLNAHDFYENQLIYGTIQDGLIENMAIYEIERNGVMAGGFASRFLVGAWVDWYSGMSIRQGDIVVCEGKLYRAIFRTATDSFTSQTKPTIETYSGKQEDAGGFYWKFMCYGDYKSADVCNVLIRNIVSYVNVTVAFEAECYVNPQRTLYPDVTPANCPKVTGIHIDNFEFKRSTTHDLFLRNDTSGWLKAAEKIEIIFSNIKGYKRPLRLQPNSEGYEDIECRAIIENFDFRENPDTRFDIVLSDGWRADIKNAIYNTNVKYSDEGGRLSSDCNMIGYNGSTTPPQNGAIGDHLIINGEFYIHNGTNWVKLT